MLVELILDFLPWPARQRERATPDTVEILPGKISTPLDLPEGVRRALNASGWLEEVIAAGELRQGKEPSLLSMIIGTALIEVLRPRRSKSLPRNFALAVTAERVVAFRAYTVGEGVDGAGPFTLSIRPGERGSWPREAVRLVDPPAGKAPTCGTLVLDDRERVPVFRPSSDTDPSTDELLELLAG
jgi:hypothetical protein